MALPTRYGIEKKINSMEGLSAYENGGKGSGNFGHAGRPGKVGGSSSSGSYVSSQSQSKTDEDENLPSSYTGKNVSLEYKAGDHQHRPTHWTTVPEDTGYGEFVELGDGKLGVKTTMSAEDTHDSIKALFETGLAKYDEPRAKADGFLDSDMNLKVSDSTMDEYNRASQHLADTAQTLEKYIKDVQTHSTATHAKGTKPGSIEEKMKQAKSLTDQWGKKLKSNPEMPKEALAKYQRRADTIAKSYETIKKIAERTPEYVASMGPDSYRTHDVTSDFDRPMTRAMAEREMKDMRAK